MKNNGMTLKSIGSQPVGRQQMIMLVDDDEAQLELLSGILKTNGYDVLPFDNALSALLAVREGNGIDLVITDYRMPGMDGLEFVKALRCLLPAVPAIMLTAHGNIDSFFKAFSLGVFEYINKPLPERELLKIVNVALGTGMPEEVPANRGGDLCS